MVEDDPLNRQFLVRLLWLKGFRVEAVDDGAEALAALAREPFDLVLMDVQLPGMNGMEATARIRADTSGRFDPTLPILALTAHTLPGDRERFLAAGMTGYIAKPVGSAELFETIAAVLDDAPGEKPPPAR